MSEESIIEKNNELIIQQMEVIQKISNNQDEIFHNIDDILTKCAETDDTLGKMQEHVGFKKTQKEKNVINEKKTPSNLSGSEKKRYESIGKAFISGAGAVFEKIRKASKFKEMMSTVKNKFSKGFEAFNKGVSNVKKKASFLGKLLLIIGLMGTIVYLFKDKIVKAIPDFSENIEILFEKVKEFIKNSVTSIYVYVIDAIGNIFTVGFTSLVHDVLPSVIRNFFDDTLPNEIEKMYLQILSGFSSSAGELYKERHGGDIKNTANDMANDAEREQQEQKDKGQKVPENVKQQEQKKPIDYTFDRLHYARGKHSSNTATIDDYNFLQQNSGLQALGEQQSFKPLEFLKDVKVNTLDGEKSVHELINEKKFDINTFLNSINKDKSDGLITSEEMKSAILSGLTQGDRNTNTEDSVKIGKTDTNNNKFIEVADNYARLQKEYADKVKEIKEQSKKQVTELNVAEPIKDQIKVFVDNIYNHFQKFFQGDAIGKNIDDRLTEIKTEFENFFNKFYEYIEKVIENIDKVTTYANTQLPEQPTQEGEGGKPESEKGDANQTSFVVNINVTPQIDMSGNIVEMLKMVVSDESVTEEIVSQSNKKLEQIIEKLKQFTPVDKEYTDNEIDKNNLYLIDLMSKMVVDNTITRKSLNKIYEAMAKAPTANNNYTNRVAVNSGVGQ